MFLDRLNAQVAGLAARLPTEAEWERACRGGTEGATWIGELSGETDAPELDAIAWYRGNSDDETHPVGRQAPNPYGLYDMLGNVYEWCADATDERDALPWYMSGQAVNPVSSGGGSYRVIRGGSWNDGAGDVRAANRDAIPRSVAAGALGFRLAGGQESAPSPPVREPRSGAPDVERAPTRPGASERDATPPRRKTPATWVLEALEACEEEERMMSHFATVPGLSSRGIPARAARRAGTAR